MAADDISNVNLPPLTWVSDTGQRESTEELPGSKKQQSKKARKSIKSGNDSSAADLEFEPAKHELDDIA